MDDSSSDVAPHLALVPLRSRTGVALITATVFASMAGFLDASVVNVAVPAISTGLGASLGALQWTVTGYLLTARRCCSSPARSPTVSAGAGCW